MSDTYLSQDPLLVWPSAFSDQSQRFRQNANTTTDVEVSTIDDERKSEIRSLAAAMKRDYPHMNRAIAWYESLVSRNPEDCREEYTQLSFLRNISDYGFDVHTFQLGARRPALEPHALKVRFHRRPL